MMQKCFWGYLISEHFSYNMGSSEEKLKAILGAESFYYDPPYGTFLKLTGFIQTGNLCDLASLQGWKSLEKCLVETIFQLLAVSCGLVVLN